MRASEFYLEAIVKLLREEEESSREAIDVGAALLADAVQADRLINVIGPGGHSNMAVEEVFWRAGGLAPVNGLLDAGTNLIHGAVRSNIVERTPGYAKAVLDAYRIAAGDVLVIANAYGINAMTIDCALECRKRGVKTIGVTSQSFAKNVPPDSPSRHPSGKSLFELVDVFIDTRLPMGDAVVELPGLPQKMGPTSTYLNSFAMNLLMMRTAETLLERGATPPVWMSANLPQGDKNNKAFQEKYGPRVKHLL